MDRNRSPWYLSGLSQSRAWLIVGMLALALAVFPTGTRRGAGGLHSENARPRLIAARGQWMADEPVAAAMFKVISPSVVFITSKQISHDIFHLHATDDQEDASTGFVWDPNGYIVTNYHVVQNSESVQVALGDQSVWKAKRVGADPDKDIAVLKVDAPANRSLQDQVARVAAQYAFDNGWRTFYHCLLSACGMVVSRRMVG